MVSWPNFVFSFCVVMPCVSVSMYVKLPNALIANSAKQS